MHVVVMGHRWELKFTHLKKNRGECDSPAIKDKQIRIDAGLEGETKLEVIVHELLHAGGWHRDEEYVDAEARDIARILWRLGYRDE